MDDARLFLCRRCAKQVLICSRCDRGQEYCGAGCATAARRESVRAAGARYQCTPRGRMHHAHRQRRYRARWRQRRDPEKVTHHGSVAPPGGDELRRQVHCTGARQANTLAYVPEGPLGCYRGDQFSYCGSRDVHRAGALLCADRD